MSLMLRSRSGSGKIYDSSEANQSFVDRHTSLHDDSSVWGSEIRGSLITDSTICHSQIKNSFVTSSFVTNAVIIDSPLIATELVAGGFILRSSVTGASRISGGEIVDSDVKNLTLLGGRLVGLDFDAREGYISRGIWARPPRIEVIGEGLTITESVTDENGLNLYCGCFEFPAHRWLKIGERYGKSLGLSVAQVDEIRQIIYSWL